MKTRLLAFVLPVAFLLFPSLAPALTDFGAEGVQDTSRVRNIVQVTDDTQTNQMKMLTGRNDPQYTPTGVKPWAKDGQWIAFTARLGGSAETNEEICTIKSDGTGFTRLTSNALSDSNASFGVDGRVYYSHYTGAPNYWYEVWRVDADGTNSTNLSAAHSAAGSESNPRISPDATKIAYVKNSLLWVAPSDGSSEMKVSGKREDGTTDISVEQYSGFSWSPDSQHLAFSGSDGTGQWIYIVNSDGSDAGSYVPSITKPPIVAPSTYHEWPQFSPDGSKIAYEWYEYSAYTNYNLRVVKTDGSSESSLDSASSDPNFEWRNLGGPFDWSPDSKWIAYRKYYNDGLGDMYHALFIIDANQPSPEPIQLTTGYNDHIPVWSPNGSQILFQSQPNTYSSYSSREDPTNGDTGDLLLLNLRSLFPWPMFLPAIEKNSNK